MIILPKKNTNVDFFVKIVNRIMGTFDYSNAFTLWKMKKYLKEIICWILMFYS